MTIQVLSETVNLKEYTVFTGKPDVNSDTIGDLHGNALKLVFFLLHEGVCSLSAEQYERLVKIYYTKCNILNARLLAQFDEIIASMTILNHRTLARLMGDDVAERGSNDYFTLTILTKLRQHKVPVEILLSNHNLGFIEANESKNRLKYKRLPNGQASSLDNLQHLIDRKLVTRARVAEMVDNAYKPMVKALSYSLDPAKNSITIYSHAPIDIKVIYFLAKKLQVPFADNTSLELASTIGNINRRFAAHLRDNTTSTLYDRNQIGKKDALKAATANNPIEMLTWNRNYDIIDRKPIHKKYAVNYVHGHDPDGPSEGNLCNLDNTLGKGRSMHQGKYDVIRSNDVTAVQAAQYIFQAQLDVLAIKMLQLQQRQQMQAYVAAETLYNGLKKSADIYFLGEQNKENYLTFKGECYGYIKASRQELEKHRGWKNIINNLCLAIIGVGVIYLGVSVAIGHFPFFATNSAQAVDKLIEHINSLEPMSGA